MEPYDRSDAVTTLPTARRNDAGAPAASLHVVQFAGVMHQEVAKIVAATIALAADPAIRQTLIRFKCDAHEPVFAALPGAIRQITVADSRQGALRRWRELIRALREVMAAGPVDVIHCHGYLPALAARLVVHRSAQAPRVLYTPHGSRAVLRYPWTTRLIERLLPRLLGEHSFVPLAFTRTEGRLLVAAAGGTPDLAEPAVADEYFDVPRHPRQPAIVINAGDHGGEAEAELFTRIAVLLSGANPPLRFSWMGLPDREVHARLKAAGINVFETRDDADAARILAQATVHLQTAYSPRFSLGVAQAMATGLPVIALDTPPYRDLIHDGQTGYLCQDERQFIDRLLALVRDPSLCQRIGEAGRAEAQRRFHGPRFRESLLRAYGYHPLAEVRPLPTKPGVADNVESGDAARALTAPSRSARHRPR